MENQFLNLDKIFTENSGFNEYSTSTEALSKASGKVVNKIELDKKSDPQELIITFDDESYLKLWDDGQSCCESRYMHSEDELDFQYHKGAVFRFCEVVKGSEQEDQYGIHETEFCNILTSKGVIQLVCHNEHNGYYGGFSLCAFYSERGINNG